MDYNRVALFVRVVEAGSFTRAAERVDLPKSSVSRSVTALEEDLGVRLLQRTTRKLALTEAGQAYYESVRGAVQGLDDAERAARDGGSDPRGRVRLAIPPDRGLAAAIAAFQRQHPAIHVEVAVASRAVDLVAEGFDLAVRAGKLEDSSLVARRIGEADALLWGSREYLARRGRPSSIEDLGGHAFVLYRASGGRATLALEGPGGARRIDVRGVIVFDDLNFCREAVAAGAGLGLLPVAFGLGGVGEQPLEVVLPAWRARGAALHVVLPSSRQLPARVALLRDHLVAHLTGVVAELERRCKKAARR